MTARRNLVLAVVAIAVIAAVWALQRSRAGTRATVDVAR